MKQQSVAITVSTLWLCLSLSACSMTAPQKAVAPGETVVAPPALTPEALAALGQAETDIKQAKAAYALWTTAEAAIKRAQEAAKAGDSATVIGEARIASEQAKLGLTQKNYPTTEK